MDAKELWERVKKEIKAHKITLTQFSQYLGIPKSTFFYWLRNKTIPDLFTAYDIAIALGVSLEFLASGENWKSEKLRMEQTKTRKSAEAEVKKLVDKLQSELKKF